MIKRAMFSRKSYDEYYKKISHHSHYTSFTNMTSLTKEKQINSKKAITPHPCSLSKTVTKENTMNTTKYPNDIESVKTPEDLHYFYVQMLQKGKKIEFDSIIEQIYLTEE